MLTREESRDGESRQRESLKEVSFVSHECIVLEEIANAQVIDPELFTKGSFFCAVAETRGQGPCAGCTVRTVRGQWQAHSLRFWPSWAS